MKIFWGYPGWGWRMYGIGSIKQNSMWFFGYSKAISSAKGAKNNG